MADCSNQGYAKCSQKYESCFQTRWKGCGKRLCQHHIEMHHNKRGVWLYHCRYRAGDIDENGIERTENNLKSHCGVKLNRTRGKIKYVWVTLWLLVVAFIILMYIVFFNLEKKPD